MRLSRFFALGCVIALAACQPKVINEAPRPIPQDKLGGFFSFDLPSAIEIPEGIIVAEGHLLGGKDKMDMYLLRGSPSALAHFIAAITLATPPDRKFEVKDGRSFLGLADPAKMALARAPAWWSPWTMKGAVMQNITDRRRGVWVCYSPDADFAYVFCWSA